MRGYTWDKGTVTVECGGASGGMALWMRCGGDGALEGQKMDRAPEILPYCETLDRPYNTQSLSAPSVKQDTVSSYLTGLL